MVAEKDNFFLEGVCPFGPRPFQLCGPFFLSVSVLILPEATIKSDPTCLVMFSSLRDRYNNLFRIDLLFI